jgi:hypothetical protein
MFVIPNRLEEQNYLSSTRKKEESKKNQSCMNWCLKSNSRSCNLKKANNLGNHNNLKSPRNLDKLRQQVNQE